MKYSLLTFFTLFAINNLLHYISEKVIIVIFILFLFFLMKFATTAVNSLFTARVEYILNDINTYMNVVFNFLYINKLFYLNLRSFRNNFLILTRLINQRVGALKKGLILNNKTNMVKYSSIELFK